MRLVHLVSSPPLGGGKNLQRRCFGCPKVVWPDLGAAYTLAGRVADAVPLLTQAVEQTTAPETGHFQALCRLSLAEAHALAEHALALARAHQEHDNQAYALCLLGNIAARRDPPDVDAAVAHYRQALPLAEDLGMRPLRPTAT